MPQNARPGDTVIAYYVGFALNSTPEIRLGYEATLPPSSGNHSLTLYITRTVPIQTGLAGVAGKGWAQQEWKTGPSDRLGAYSLDYGHGRAADLFWLK